MRNTIPAGDRPVPLTPKDPALPLGLHTGHFDDRRETIAPDDHRYTLFSQAHADQDGWDDEKHRDYWTAHLQLWKGRRGNRSNRDALAFVLVMARVEGVSYEQMVEALPGWTWADLRDRGVLKIADRMWETLDGGGAEPPGMPRPTRTESGDWSFPGPAHPDVIRACRLWRLPRVYALDGAGEEEARLPPPMAGHDNLPQEFGDRDAFGAIGDASFQAVERGCVALNALRAEARAGSRARP